MDGISSAQAAACRRTPRTSARRPSGFPRSTPRRSAPRPPARARAAGFREMVAHQLHVMQRREHGRLGGQRLTSASRSAEVLVSMALNARPIRSGALPAAARRANSMRCIWRRTACRSSGFQIVEADGGERLRDLVPLGLAHAAEKYGSRQSPCRRDRTPKAGRFDRYPRFAADRRCRGYRARRDRSDPRAASECRRARGTASTCGAVRPITASSAP